MKTEKLSKRAAKRAKRRPQRELRESITPELLREIFETHIVNSRWRIPTDSALVKLASILAFWRGYYWHHLTIEPLANEAFEYALKLQDALLRLRPLYVEGYGETRLDLFRSKIEAIDSLLRALPSVAKLDVVRRLPDDDRTPKKIAPPTWRWLAHVLPVDFEVAMKSTNPKYRIGFGHTGPVPKFIEAIAPYLTGEHPTSDSVATQLKTMGRERPTADSVAAALRQKGPIQKPIEDKTLSQPKEATGRKGNIGMLRFP